MLARFLAIHAQDPDRLQSLARSAAEHHGLTILHQCRDVLVLGDPREAIPLGSMDGVVLGRLFTRAPGTERMTHIDGASAAGIVASRGRDLLDRYWGGYVAFIAHPTGSCRILRDPSGEVPCFYRTIENAILLSSDISLATFPGVASPVVDWMALDHHLRHVNAPGRATALLGVKELVAGESLVLDSSMAVEPLWSPWNFVGAQEPIDAAELHAVVQHCCATWGSIFDRICLKLSGGLDSSVIASCLADHRDLRALNFAWPSPSGDEQDSATSVADQLGIALRACEPQSGAINLDRVASRATPRPTGRLISQATDFEVAAVLGGAPLSASFNGEGGDNVFCFLQSPLPAIDRLRSDGSGLGTWRTIQDTATLTHTSIFTVSRWIVRRLVRGQATMIAQRNSTLLATAVRDAEGSDQYPCWVLPPTDSLPGKAAHVAGLYRAQARSRSLEDGRPVVSPLLSQPIVEAALGVPTWRWCEGGIDRALVRQAFREQLPASVVQRRWKGGADGFCLAFISAHRAELRSRLLDGNLARAGLLDRDAVEAALSDAGLLRGKNYASIMELTEAEGWAQYWVDQQTVVDRSLPASPSRRANAPDPMPS